MTKLKRKETWTSSNFSLVKDSITWHVFWCCCFFSPGPWSWCYFSAGAALPPGVPACYTRAQEFLCSQHRSAHVPIPWPKKCWHPEPVENSSVYKLCWSPSQADCVPFQLQSLLCMFPIICSLSAFSTSGITDQSVDNVTMNILDVLEKLCPLIWVQYSQCIKMQ